METQNDDPKVIRSEWKVWLELERTDYYEGEDSPEDYIDEEVPRSIAYRPTESSAAELMSKIEDMFGEINPPHIHQPPAKRYYLYNIKIQNGEYEHSSRSARSLPVDADAKEYAAEYIKDFYGDDGERTFDDDWYYFNGGEIAAKMLSVQEITEEEDKTFRIFYF